MRSGCVKSCSFLSLATSSFVYSAFEWAGERRAELKDEDIHESRRCESDCNFPEEKPFSLRSQREFVVLGFNKDLAPQALHFLSNRLFGVAPKY